MPSSENDWQGATNRRNILKVSGGLLGGIALGTTVAVAERTDRFIVDIRGRASVRKLEQNGLQIVHDLSEADLAVVEGAESDLKAVTDEYEADTELRLKKPDTPSELADREANTFPNLDVDLYDGYAWDKQAQDIKEAHETTKGEGTRVGVIDDGIFAGHPDLEVNEALSKNFSLDDNGSGALFDDHGTHVAGTIAAADNGAGVLGTAPETELVDLRVFSGAGATFGSILAAIVYAAAIDCDVANLSLGAYPIPRQGLGEFYGKALNRIMTFANKEGTLLVIAAGNDGANLQTDKNFISLPNEGAQGVAVAATGPEGFLFDDGEPDDPAESPAFYTNYGTNNITLGAPGGDLDLEALAQFIEDDGELTSGEIFNLIGDWVLSTTFDAEGEKETKDLDGDGDPDIVTNEPENQIPGYGYKLGTSMAAPQVAGAAALVKSANPDYGADQVEAALKEAAEVPEDYDKAFYGSGFVNVVDAL